MYFSPKYTRSNNDSTSSKAHIAETITDIQKL